MVNITHIHKAGNFALMAWIKLDSLPSTNGRNFAIINKYRSDMMAVDGEWILWITTDNTVKFYKMFFYWGTL